MGIPIDPITRAYETGHAAILAHGRSLLDLVADGEGELRPLLELLRRTLRRRFGLHVVTYSLAEGLDWNPDGIEDGRDRAAVEGLLREHGLLDLEQGPGEVPRLFRAIAALVRAGRRPETWTDGQPLGIAFILPFAEHLMPSVQGGIPAEDHVAAVQLAYAMAQSLSLRASRHLLLLHGREGLVDPLVAGVLHRVQLRLPDRDEKHTFVTAAMNVYTRATFEGDLTAEQAAHLASNTPNRGIEHLLRNSHRTGTPVSAIDLTSQKAGDIEAISEGTLHLLDPSRVLGVRLVGRNIQHAAGRMVHQGEMLRRGSPHASSNIVLCGSPGVGKTDLALISANEAGAATFSLLNPKAGIVGETERRCRLQQDLLDQFAPVVGFIDELTDLFPLERTDFNGDSGASQAVMASFLTGLSNESRRGRVLTTSTTKSPWRMADDMRARMDFLPVLQPLRDDMPAIVSAISERLVPGVGLDAAHQDTVAAGHVFYEKGATPRHIRQALSNVMQHGAETLTPATVLLAARCLQVVTGRASAIYADLWAIRSCLWRPYFPWHSDPANYPFPEYLKGVVDERTGEVLMDALETRIEEYRPHANL